MWGLSTERPRLDPLLPSSLAVGGRAAGWGWAGSERGSTFTAQAVLCAPCKRSVGRAGAVAIPGGVPDRLPPRGCAWRCGKGCAGPGLRTSG